MSKIDYTSQPTTPPFRGGWIRLLVGQMVSPQPEGDLQDHTSSHSSHLPFHSSHLTFSPRWRPRPLQRHPPSDPVPRSKPPLSFPSNLSSASSSSVTLFFYPKKDCPLRLSVSLLLHFFSLLIRAGIEPHPGPIQGRLQTTGPMQLPHMLHTGPTFSTLQGAGVLRLGTNSFDPLVRGLRLPSVPLHRTQFPIPDELCCSRNCLRERQVPAVQLQRHSSLPRRAAELPTPSPGAGRLRARD